MPIVTVSYLNCSSKAPDGTEWLVAQTQILPAVAASFVAASPHRRPDRAVAQVSFTGYTTFIFSVRIHA